MFQLLKLLLFEEFIVQVILDAELTAFFIVYLTRCQQSIHGVPEHLEWIPHLLILLLRPHDRGLSELLLPCEEPDTTVALADD